MKFVKYISVLIALLTFGLNISAQNFSDKNHYLLDSLNLEIAAEADKNLIDSLINIYHKTNVDTTKLGLISQIVEECYDDNIWPRYNTLLLNKSQEFLSNPNHSKQEKKYFKTAMASAINNKGYLLYSQGDYDKAIKQYDISLNLYLEAHNKDGIASCYNNIGSIYDDRGDTEQALKYYLKSLSFVEQIGDKEGIALSLNNIGYVYSDMGQVVKALDYYRRSVKILEHMDDKQVLATTYNNIGYIYKVQEDYVKALEYYEKCLALFEEINYKEGIASSYNNIGLILSKQDTTITKALEYYKKSLEIQSELGYKKGQAETANNIGTLYMGLSQLDLAFNYYKQSLMLREDIGDKSGKIHSLASVGMVYLEQGKLDKAKKFGLKSYELAQELNLPESFIAPSRLLMEVYRKEKNPTKELEMFRLYISTRDSLNSQQNKKAAIKYDIQYQFETQAFKDSLAQAEVQKIKDLEHQQAIDKQKTYIFIGLIVCGLMALVIAVVLRGYQLKRKSNAELAEKNEVIEQKNLEITDSINYAQRIQEAIIPTQKTLNEYLKDCFVMYRPKDIVAGDFYWLQKSGDEILYAAADCTGHGVPGAMVSVVCNNALNRAIKEYKLTEPAKILDKAREFVVETFLSEGGEERVIKDGMDIALCSINFTDNMLQFSGANNSLYIIRNNEILETKADKQPVGKHHKESPFTNHQIEIQKGDLIYTFSDGYPDQFGGEKGKKFMYKQFKNLLLTIADKPMADQHKILEHRFDEWKGELEQIDDVCIIGVRI